MTNTPELSALQDLCARLEWARESRSKLQMRDVRLLLDGPLDRAYLDSWARRLGLDALLKEVADE